MAPSGFSIQRFHGFHCSAFKDFATAASRAINPAWGKQSPSQLRAEFQGDGMLCLRNYPTEEICSLSLRLSRKCLSGILSRIWLRDQSSLTRFWHQLWQRSFATVLLLWQRLCNTHWHNVLLDSLAVRGTSAGPFCKEVLLEKIETISASHRRELRPGQNSVCKVRH